MKSRGAVLVAALSVMVAAAACSGGGRPALKGTVIQDPPPAADFMLPDQHGTPFHLADARGKVVVLCFIYTHCTDICPFIALKLKEADALLGKDARNVVFVAVTTDPERDTEQVIADYSREAGLFDTWHFVTGPAEDLRKVWAAYGIGVAALPPADGGHDTDTGAAETSLQPDPTHGLSSDELGLAARIVDAFGGGYEVTHTAPFWLVDTKGRMRVVMDAFALPSDIADNARTLLRGR